MEQLQFFLTDRFNLIVLCISAIGYYYILFFYYKQIKGKESKAFLALKKTWIALMIFISIAIYSTFLSYLIILIFGNKPIENLNLVYFYVAIILVPIIHQLILRMFIKWTNGD